jgi:hypothetical protein
MKQANQPAIDQPALQRRKLLGAAGTTGALAAAATVLATRHAEPEVTADTQPGAAAAKGGGYRLSEHVMRYYQTTKV